MKKKIIVLVLIVIFISTIFPIQQASAVSYIISFNANGGSGAPSAQTKTQGVVMYLSNTIPNKAGWYFLGWSTSSTATSATWAAGGAFYVDSNTLLYAVWSAMAPVKPTIQPIYGTTAASCGDLAYFTGTASPAVHGVWTITTPSGTTTDSPTQTSQPFSFSISGLVAGTYQIRLGVRSYDITDPRSDVAFAYTTLTVGHNGSLQYESHVTGVGHKEYKMCTVHNKQYTGVVKPESWSLGQVSTLHSSTHSRIDSCNAVSGCSFTRTVNNNYYWVIGSTYASGHPHIRQDKCSVCNMQNPDAPTNPGVYSTCSDCYPIITMIKPQFLVQRYFALPNDFISLEAEIINNPSNVSIFYPKSGGLVATMYYYSGLYKYIGAFTATSGMSYEALPGPYGYNSFNVLEVVAQNTAGTYANYAGFAMLMGANIATYQLVQPSINWTSPLDTPFQAPYTGPRESPNTYNCTAYSVNVENKWMDNLLNNGPLNNSTEVENFMLKNTSKFQNRDGIKYNSVCAVNEYPEVIWYSNYHFAKVVEWNQDGTPKTIDSKWGRWELVRSQGYNVFTSEYGSPIGYYKR